MDLVTGSPTRPDGAGMYLHWDGRKSYRTHMPVPRVLEPVPQLSTGSDDGNLVIAGDNLQIMVSLRPQYRASVDVAYLDPPYNTGRRDFAYSDRRFRDPNADSEDAVYVSNEDGGRHTKWLNFMAPRLHLVHELLADHGVCFVSISDVELFRLGMLMDEIFGERSRLGIFIWKGAIENNPTMIATEHEYVLCYAKDAHQVPRVWQGESQAKQWLLSTYARVVGESRDAHPSALEKLFQAEIARHEASRKREVTETGESDLVELGRASRYKFVDKRGVYAAEDHTDKPTGGYFYEVIHPLTGKACKRPESGYRFTQETMARLLAEDRVLFRKDHTRQVQVKKYLADIADPMRSVIDIPAKLGTGTLKKLLGEEGAKRFPHPKPVELIELLLDSMGYTDQLVLDPFAGSGTTAHAVMRLNARDGGQRRFIMIEEGSPELDVCRTVLVPRLMAASRVEKSRGAFTFLEAGRRLNREAILDLERKAITNLIVQTDITGTGVGIKRIDGLHVIGCNHRREALCLRWNGRADSAITNDVLISMFEEAKTLGLHKPLRVYGSTCVVGETDSFRFCHIPDEIMAALHLSDEAEAVDAGPEVVATVEALEAASQRLVRPRGQR